MSRPYAAKLQELLQASFNLPNAVCDLGRIELGPAEIEEVTHNLYKHDKSGIDAKAHYLLAASGFNAEQVLRDISLIKFPKKDALSYNKSSAPSSGTKQLARTNSNNSNSSKKLVSTISDGGIQTSSTLAIVEPLVKESMKRFDDYLVKHVHSEWNVEKLTSTESKSSENSVVVIEKEDLGSRILGPQINEPVNMTPVMRAYGEVVTELCDKRLEVPDLINRFLDAFRSSGSNQSYTNDSWRALSSSSPTAFLEQQYREYIDHEINSHRKGAKLGGVPTCFNKIKAFVNLKYNNNGEWDRKLTLINKTPIWTYLYYLIRAGYYKDALQLVLERKDIFETMGSTFAVFLKAWVDSPTHQLSSHYTVMIHSEYLQLFRPGIKFDPYKQALYKLIGKCDLTNKNLPQVAVTTEDWLWLQFMLISDESQYTVNDLRKYILEIGMSHLADDSYKYFTILVLLKLYPEALSFMKTKDEPLSVHFAICLAATHKLTIEDAEKCNYMELLGHYTRAFRQSTPNLAVDYITLIALCTKGPEPCYEALQQLILETGRFSDLVGDRAAFTDEIVPGSIEKRMEVIASCHKMNTPSHAAYLSYIPREAALKAKKEGNIVDAILLFRLAGDSTIVLELVNQQLGILLAGVQLGQKVPESTSTAYEILQLAKNMMRIDRNALSGSKSKAVCLQLLDIADCIDLFAGNLWQQCLERISDTKLIVLSANATVDEICSISEQFQLYDESISRNIPNLMVMAMTCIVNTVKDIQKSNSQNSSIVLSQYKERASNCMIYAGLIQFKMPRTIFWKLTQLESQLA